MVRLNAIRVRFPWAFSPAKTWGLSVSSTQDILTQWGKRVRVAWFSAWRVLLIGA